MKGMDLKTKIQTLDVSLSKSKSRYKANYEYKLMICKNDLLGYEIVKNGKVIGFTTSGTYTDSEVTDSK